MNFYGYPINTPLAWLAVAVIIAIGLALYFSAVWFVQKFATGMVGGFILMATGFGLILGPTFRLIRGNVAMAEMILSVAAIFAGCVTILVGAFSLRDYEDF